jgi:uncharacterized membrane protein YhaH (DUF805 family)
MGFLGALRSCFKKYATGFGRASRSEFWFWYLFMVLATIVASVIDITFFPHRRYGYGHEYGPTEIAVNLFLLMPWLAVAARRLHDIGKSGMWFLISLTIIGFIPLIYWWCKAGDPGDNRFGNPPLTPVPPSQVDEKRN